MGAIDFRRIFESLDRPKQKEYIVERDTQVHPLETAQIGYGYLRNLRGTPTAATDTDTTTEGTASTRHTDRTSVRDLCSDFVDNLVDKS